MQKPNCILQAYPSSFVSFDDLCDGIDYQVRFRENHNSQVGPWTTAFTFTVPGTTDPLVGFLDAADDTICEGECTTLSAGVSGGCGLVMSYDWNTGSTNSQINVCPTQTTTYTVEITEECSELTTNESITVYVEPSPDAGIAEADTNEVCEGETVDLTLVGYEDDTIQWQSAPDATGPWTDIPGATDDAFESPPINDNTSCFRAEVGECGTPSYSNIVCITVKDVPTIEAVDTTICDGETIDISTTVSDPGGNYLWEIDNSTNATLLGVSPNNTTNYIVHYELNDCETEDTSTVIVYKQPRAKIIVDTVCYSDATTFVDNSELDESNGDVIDTWDWDFGDGNTSTQENPLHTYSSENIYDIRLIVETNNGCKDTTNKETVVYPLPQPNFSVPNVCLNVESEFTDNSDVSSAATQNNITDWFWNFDDGNTSNEVNPIYTYDSDGTYDVELTLTTNNGCVNDTAITTIIHPRPNVVFSADNTVSCSPLCMTLSSNSSINSPSLIETYNWYINNELVQSGENDSYSDCIKNKTDDTHI
ncbi:MAG: PKD domain-containing protein, partial [Brumimicrobium sp.]